MALNFRKCRTLKDAPPASEKHLVVPEAATPSQLTPGHGSGEADRVRPHRRFCRAVPRYESRRRPQARLTAKTIQEGGTTLNRQGQPHDPSRPAANEPTPRHDAHEEERPLAEVRRNLNEIWRMVSLHRWMFFVPFCIVSSGAFVASLYYPRTYQARTTFERKNDPVMMNLPMSTGAASFKLFRNTIVRDLRSVPYMSEVVEKIGLLDDADRDENGALTESGTRQQQSLARSLAGTLSISTSSPSELIDVISITYTGPDAKIGRNLVEQAKKTYIRRTMEWIHEFLVKQRDYFQNEADLALTDLRKAQHEDMKLKLDNPLAAPGDASQVSARIAQLEMERRALELRLREYEAERASHEELLAALGEDMPMHPLRQLGDNFSYGSVPPSEETLQILSRIESVTTEIETLRRTRGMTDQHPTIVDLMNTREMLHERLAGQRETDELLAAANIGVTPAPAPPVSALSPAAREWQRTRTQLQVKTAAQQRKIKEIKIDLDTNSHAMDQLTKAKAEMFERRDEFEEVQARVGKAKQRFAQHEQTLAGIVPAIKTIEQGRLLQFSEGTPATGGGTPVSPKSTSIVLLALLAGVAAGVLFVVLAELVDGVFRSSTNVARSLGLPVLESIDEIVTGKDRRKLLVQRAVITPMIVLCCLGVTGLTGSMAYLSLRRPWAYERIRSIPQAAIDLFFESNDTGSGTGN